MNKTLNLTAKMKSSIFKIVGTKQFKVESNIYRYTYGAYFYYRGRYISCASGDFTHWEDCSKEQEYISYLYANKEKIRERIAEVRKSLKLEEKAQKRLARLASKYENSLNNTIWYYASDLGILVQEKDNRKDLVGLKQQPDDSLGPDPHRDFILSSSKGLIRFSREDNCFYTSWDNGLTEKVEAVNWYGYGFNDGYNDNFCTYRDSIVSDPPEFPTEEAHQSYDLGYSYGAYRGAMDT